MSPLFGVYVKVKGLFDTEVGVTEPLPFSVIVTFFALPPKVFPDIVTGVRLQIVPEVLIIVTVGLFVHCPDVRIDISINKQTRHNNLFIFLLFNLILNA
jgi:hypothetical protein